MTELFIIPTTNKLNIKISQTPQISMDFFFRHGEK